MTGDHFETDERFALSLDEKDPLRGFRHRFHVPEGKIYLLGNSLGLMSRDAEAGVTRALDEWRQLAIHGWMEADPPWLHLAERVGAKAARLVGAAAQEVVATGTTTVNIHSLVSTFYRPEGGRTKILADTLNFPTDVYALRGQVMLRGLDPAEHLLLAPSADGRTLDEDELIGLMTDDVALVFLPSVVYRSAQLLDMERLAGAARERGIPIGFDCSHSVGVVPHRFDDWDVDFAVWCGYKHLGSGPGGGAFLFLNRRHFDREPLLPGWFGYVKEKQFEMRLEFEHARCAGGWQISSSPILGLAPVEGTLDMILEAGLESIRRKSIRITSYLVFLIDELLRDSPRGFAVGSPRDPDRRGAHVALEVRDGALEVHESLTRAGVIADYRPPNVIRLCPEPLYNTYHEVWRTVQCLL